MSRLAVVLVFGLASAKPAWAQPQPALKLTIQDGPVLASKAAPGCDPHDSPDAPARAVRLANGTVQLYATDQVNQLDTGSDLLHLVHSCRTVYRGSGDDDPAAYDDRAWLATPWTDDGKTIWAIVHDEFHGNERKQLCPTGRYMDCWYNALTLAVSHDGGRQFQRAPGQNQVATLPYRYDEVGRGHHGYFNPTNIITFNGLKYMMMFATRVGAQADGNCLMRTASVASAHSWRAWDGSSFTVSFADPYRASVQPEAHVCAPVGSGNLRWPVTSLIRFKSEDLFVAIMQNTAHDGGVYYATSADLVHWSAPTLLLSVPGMGGWTCADAAPAAYPSLLDATSSSGNFETVGDAAELFMTGFVVEECRIAHRRSLIRWTISIQSLQN